MARIGMLTPSSNTVLEPESYALLREIEGVSLHFSRFKVTEIALDRQALGQFDDAPMLDAAELLGHAKVDCITWNGTSAGWLGLDADRALVRRIEERTGIRASTCVLTLFDILRRRGLTRIGLVTPYTEDVQQRIVANFETEGVATVAESHLGIRDNFSFGLVDAETLDRGVRRWREPGPTPSSSCARISAPRGWGQRGKGGLAFPSSTRSQSASTARWRRRGSTPRISPATARCSPIPDQVTSSQLTPISVISVGSPDQGSSRRRIPTSRAWARITMSR